MTATTNNVLKAQKTFLDSLAQAQTDTSLLLGVLKQMREDSPGLFVGYVAADDSDAIKSNSLDWSEEYFTRQKKYAEFNFSIERLEHLIAVRDYFRKHQRKGFAPVKAVASQPSSAGLYTPSNNLKVFVEEGDLLTIRTALHMELNDNRHESSTLRAALEWVKARQPDLCETYGEKAFARATDSDQSKWTSDYYSEQEVYLDSNFCEERFLHLIEVRERLRQQGVKGFVAQKPTAAANPSSQLSTRAPDHQQQRSSSVEGRAGGLNPVLKMALMVGGALAALVVLIVSLAK
ncbi:hypothetical protein [uncultured Pseudomonas sp.]|uniref:hypothetical protein n=1 Tax=uncultured Pseudomonas sp. TaxID=114707 RepID=UPI0025EE2DD5|nr:hypothetical protein [uncultured Pseudomonas sp.]